MAAEPKSITPAELRARLHDGGEIAVVDAREEGSFHQRHLLMASCLPLSPARADRGGAVAAPISTDRRLRR